MSHEFLWLIGEPTGLHTWTTLAVFPWQLKIHHSRNATTELREEEVIVYMFEFYVDFADKPFELVNKVMYSKKKC